MQHDSQPKSAELSPKKPYHVHPLIAWMAIFNFALIFSLAPSMILAQTTTAAMSEGSDAVATRLPESSKLAYAKHVARAEEGTHLSVTAQDRRPNGSGVGLTAAASCVRSCRITKSDCTRAADSDSIALHACNVKAATCVQACGGTGVGAAAALGSGDDKNSVDGGLRAANEAYKAAVAAARQKRDDAVGKAQSDFTADMQAAKDALKTAKDAAKAAAAAGTSAPASSSTSN